MTYFRMLRSIMKISIKDMVKLSEISKISVTKEIPGEGSEENEVSLCRTYGKGRR